MYRRNIWVARWATTATQARRPQMKPSPPTNDLDTEKKNSSVVVSQRPPSGATSQPLVSASKLVLSSDGERLLPEHVAARKEKIELARQVIDPVEREVKLNATERAYPVVPRAIALKTTILADTNIRHILRPRGLDGVTEDVPVKLTPNTAAEHEILLKFLRYHAMDPDIVAPPGLADLPQLDLDSPDSLCMNARRVAGHIRPDGSADGPDFDDFNDSIVSIPDVKRSDFVSLQGSSDDAEAPPLDADGFTFVIAVEKTTLNEALDIISDRFNCNLRHFRCAIASTRKSSAVALVWVTGLTPGHVLSINTMRIPRCVIRVSNLWRCDHKTYMSLVERSLSETTVVLRRVECPIPELEARLRAIAERGCLRYELGGLTQTRAALVFEHFVNGRVNEALCCFLDEPNAHPAIVEFLKFPRRVTAQKLVNNPAYRSLRSVHFNVIRVLGASGTSTAAICSLPKSLRKRLYHECVASAFNAMLSRRMRRHGPTVVVGDIVRAGESFGCGQPVPAESVKRVESEAEAKQYSISDVLLPWLGYEGVGPQHFPTCSGLTFAEVVELLAPLHLAWLLPGLLPPTTPPFVMNEFWFPFKDTVMLRPVWTKPRVDVRLFSHPPPFDGQHFDSTLVLPHDRALLMAGIDPAPSADSVYPWVAIRDLPQALSGRQSTWPSPRSTAPSVEGGSEFNSRAAHRRLPSGAKYLNGYTLDEASFVSIPLNGAPQLTEPLAPPNELAHVCSVVTAVMRFRIPTPNDVRCFLRECFLQHGVTSNPDASLEHALHDTMTAEDTQLGVLLATKYCQRCYSWRHTTQGCPLTVHFDELIQRRREENALWGRKAALALSTPVRISRAATTMRWGLSLKGNGDIDRVIKDSPAHVGLAAAGMVMAHPAEQGEGPETVQATSPMRVTGINGVFCDGAEEVAQAMAKAENPLSLELNIRVKTRVLTTVAANKETPVLEHKTSPRKNRRELSLTPTVE